VITGIQDVYYNVQDMKRAVAFYTEVLGCTQTFGDEYWSALEVGGLRLGLHGTGGEPVPATPRDAHGQNCGGTLTFRSDDVAEDRKRLEAAGAKILGEDDAAWGHMLVFEDLDGNVLKVMKPKG
jgi:predicted enzyme related to lactoylglutathione lyase